MTQQLESMTTHMRKAIYEAIINFIKKQNSVEDELGLTKYKIPEVTIDGKKGYFVEIVDE